jgi:peptidoglycan/LPS O-acetylase OafA/YrhL
MKEINFRHNNFDLLRIFAATEVVIQHCIHHFKLEPLPLLKPILMLKGVPIFFVISGFLISASFEKNNDLKKYFTNRMLRIFPGLWACVLITSIIIFYFNNSVIPVSGFFQWLFLQLAGFIYTPGFFKSFGMGSYNGSLWTIPIELQFYFCIPVMYYLSERFPTRNGLVFIAFLASGILTLLFGINSYATGIGFEDKVEKLIRYSFIPHIYLFLAGVLFQKLKLYKTGLIYGKGIIWLIIFAGFSYLLPASFYTSFFSSLLLVPVTISLAYTMPDKFSNVLKGNDISYGVYIYHGLLINIFIELHFTGTYFHLFCVGVLAYLLGFLSWILIEKKFILKKQHRMVSQLAYNKPNNL